MLSAEYAPPVMATSVNQRWSRQPGATEKRQASAATYTASAAARAANTSATFTSGPPCPTPWPSVFRCGRIRQAGPAHPGPRGDAGRPGRRPRTNLLAVRCADCAILPGRAAPGPARLYPPHRSNHHAARRTLLPRPRPLPRPLQKSGSGVLPKILIGCVGLVVLLGIVISVAKCGGAPADRPDRRGQEPGGLRGQAHRGREPGAGDRRPERLAARPSPSATRRPAKWSP